MIEKTVLNYLGSRLEVPVVMERASNSPPFVLIEKTGSSKNNNIINSTFAIQSYADSLYNAADLNEKVKAVMDEMSELDGISSAKLNSDYNFTDTTKKMYRYQSVYDIVHL